MILVLTDADGRTAAKADITGSLWIAAHNGFVNHDEIRMRVERSGPFAPSEGWLMDLMGVRVSHLEVTMGKIYRGGIPVFPAGSVSLSLSVVP